MFGKNFFIIQITLLWCLLTVTLVESARQKKDVHHMIILSEDRRPPKSHRHKNHEHFDHHPKKGPRKSRKKPGSFKKSPDFEDSIESGSLEEFSRHKPKSKRHYHHHHQNRHPFHHQKRHNDHRFRNEHKKHHNDHHHPHFASGNDMPKDGNNLPTDNWIPMSSKELFGKEPPQHLFRENPPGHHHLYSQPIPMEITTPVNFYFQSTMFPPLSSTNSAFTNHKPYQNSPSPSIESVEPYKPFDYSILESKSPSLPPGESYPEQELSSSNIVTLKKSGGKNGSPFAIILDSSREQSKRKENIEVEEDKKGDREKEKRDKLKEKARRGRGKYRIKSKY